MNGLEWVMLICGSACAGIAIHYCFECKRLSKVARESLSDGWKACEAHARAHAAICPEPSADEAFDAGVEVGISRGLAKARELEPARSIFAMGVRIGVEMTARCDCANCAQEERHRVN